MYKLYSALLGIVCLGGKLNAQTISFTAPDTVCAGTPVNITNQSTGANYYWQFCNSQILPTAAFRNIGNPSSMLQKPVFAVPVKEGNNYYVFCVNHINSFSGPGNLLRMNYGSSLLNTPTVTDLGIMGVMPVQSEQLEIRKDGNNWYGILVGGGQLAAGPVLVTINFGSSLANTPTAVNYGDVGTLSYPIGVHVFKEANSWYAYVVNRGSSTIARISYGSSLGNAPTGVNLSNIGNLYNPTTCRFIKDGSKWYGYIPNYGDNTLTRLDFGISLLNTPTGTNLGNLGNKLSQPTDLIQFRTCNELGGYITNGSNEIVKISFAGDSATGSITATNLGNQGNLYFPHSISESVRIGDTLYSFIPNADNNTLTLMTLASCTQSGIPSSAQNIPPAYTYSAPGTYTITLHMDEGTATQMTACKEIIVVPQPTATITQSNNTLTVTGSYISYQWYKDGVVVPNATSGTITTTQPGAYYVKVSNGHCIGQSNTLTIRASGIHNVHGTALNIYPNPATDVLFISSTAKVNATLSSIDGRRIIEQKNVTEMRLGALAAGIYMLTVTDEHGQLLAVEKVVKQQ